MIQVGSNGPEVGNLQRFLRENGFLDSNGNALLIDEDFGDKTAWALKCFQLAAQMPQVPITGTFDDITRAFAISQGFIPFVEARNYTHGSKRIVANLIVIHTMEAPEKPGTAHNVALWFAGDNAPRASAHYCVDEVDTIQCVRDTDVAWHAPGANQNGIGIEHAGYARFNDEDWSSDGCRKMLERSAQLAARLCRRWAIPVVKLSSEDLKQVGVGGFCGHIDVTNAFNNGKGHTDPGGNFPWALYLARVKEILAS